MANAPLKIILTNDDGYDAPGITTLYTALVDAGFDVHIVAPAVNQSAQGSSLGGTSALATPIDITEYSPGNYYVDGKPAAAALTGLDDLFAGDPPDLIISGTNRGDNIGESENISGTVNGAIQGLFEGVPAIAVSTASFSGSYDTGFANAANFMVSFLQELQDAQGPGQPLLPEGEGLTVNVPGNPDLDGVTVTTVTPESSASFPYAPNGTPDTYAEGFSPNTLPSGSPTSEASQFLTNHVTISPIDGNWGATESVRDDLAVRLGSTLSTPASAPAPLNILLVDEDGHDSAGITATRDSLLAAGYNVTVLAPATDQSGVGSALYIAGPITVTQYDANDYSANFGTPASLVALALDPQGLLNGVKPDLIVVGADQGDAVGIENANHSATLGGAITALFNYDVPSIALTAASAADFATSADFLTTLIENLQLTQASSSSLLPEGVGLSINVPVGASANDFAFTNIDGGTDANLSVLGNDNFAHFSYGAPVAGTDPHSEGDAYNAGEITVSPIDGSIAVHDSGAYDALAALIGTTYGDPNEAPAIAGDLMIAVNEGAAVVVTTADLNEADPDSSGAALTYKVTATDHGQVLVGGAAATSFSQLQLAGGEVSFLQDGSAETTASFTVSLADGSGLTASATVSADVTLVDQAPIFSSPSSVSIAENYTFIEKVMATDPEHDAFVFSIAGGDDSGYFTINPHSGVLSFLHAPDFEHPHDSNGNNVYEVVVAATDSHGAASQQAIDVTVTDVHERGKSGNDHKGGGPTGNHGHDAFVFDNGFGHNAATNLSHQEAVVFDQDLFANVREIMDSAHGGGHDTVTVADAGHGLTLDHVSPHHLNAHDFSFA
jgi:5'/3'-nucleotidase SurE